MNFKPSLHECHRMKNGNNINIYFLDQQLMNYGEDMNKIVQFDLLSMMHNCANLDSCILHINHTTIGVKEKTFPVFLIVRKFMKMETLQ